MSPQGSSQDIPSSGDSTAQMSRHLQSESDDPGGGRGGGREGNTAGGERKDLTSIKGSDKDKDQEEGKWLHEVYRRNLGITWR